MVCTYVVLSPPSWSLWDASHELKFDHSELTLKRPQVNVMSWSKKDLLLHMNGSVLLSWTVNTFQVLSSLYRVFVKSCRKNAGGHRWTFPLMTFRVITRHKLHPVPGNDELICHGSKDILRFWRTFSKQEAFVLFLISHYFLMMRSRIWPAFRS